MSTYAKYVGGFGGGSGGSGVMTVGTIDSQTPSSDGLVISVPNIYAQSASLTNPGMVNLVAQSFKGQKTINSSNGGSGISLTLTNGNGAAAQEFLVGALGTKYNWLIGAQYNKDQTFEITPSTGTGGQTYTTPIFSVSNSGASRIGAGTAAAIFGNQTVLTVTGSNTIQAYIGTDLVDFSQPTALIGFNDGTNSYSFSNDPTTNGLNFTKNTTTYLTLDMSGSGTNMKFPSNGSLHINANTSSAVLEASSTTKGFLPPVMTTTQKNAISSPAAGLIVFDTTLSKLCVYSGSAWQTITSV